MSAQPSPACITPQNEQEKVSFNIINDHLLYKTNLCIGKIKIKEKKTMLALAA